MYCFIHGLPTRNPGSWMPGAQKPMCGNERCLALAQEHWPEMWRRSMGRNWPLRAAMECAVCSAERRRRCCIIDVTGPEAAKYTEEPFTNAPFVHSFRHPSYHAQQLRAINFAKATNRRLLWVTAHDVLKQSDAGHRKDQEELRKERWIEFHDRLTSGIPGLLP